MTRLSYGMDWCELEKLAESVGVKLVYRRSRCQHGYTREETCVDCEGGYGTDSASYGCIGEYSVGPKGENGYAVSDDDYDVAYWPKRLSAKFDLAIHRADPKYRYVK